MALHLSATVSHHVQYQDSSAEAIKWNPAIILIATCVFFPTVTPQNVFSDKDTLNNK